MSEPPPPPTLDLAVCMHQVIQKYVLDGIHVSRSGLDWDWTGTGTGLDWNCMEQKKIFFKTFCGHCLFLIRSKA